MAACAAVPTMSVHAQTTGSGANANVVKSGVEAWQRQDFAGAVRQWETAAAKGDADAEFNLGQAYRLGKGVPQDMAKAEFYFGRAARKGHPQAGDNYGIVLFQSGRQTEALPWLNTAADRGEPRAMYILGIAAFNGDYVGKDWVRAYALMTRAAASGLPQATNQPCHDGHRDPAGAAANGHFAGRRSRTESGAGAQRATRRQRSGRQSPGIADARIRRAKTAAHHEHPRLLRGDGSGNAPCRRVRSHPGRHHPRPLRPGHRRPHPTPQATGVSSWARSRSAAMPMRCGAG